MVDRQLYCHCCDTRFNIAAGAKECPRCGETMVAWLDAPTQEMSGTIHQTGPNEANDEPDDQLMGMRLGNYRIEAFLGKGGMARVYRARHLTLERPCAIKILRPSRTTDNEQGVELLLAEARAAASLIHPHVVTLHTIGHEGDLHFLEMEFIDGRTLAEIVRATGPLTPTEATRLMVQISSALSAAHRMGMIHRDIKPSNVMVTQAGEAKLSDFGLAKRVVTAMSETDPRFLTGTPYYMAPELFQGALATCRTDVYAMGVLYYCLLTGELPVQGNSVDDLLKLHARRLDIDLQELLPVAGPSIKQVVERCLDPIAERRYVDAGELFGEMRAVYGSLRDLQGLLHESLAEQPVTIEGSGDKFVVTVDLPNDRSQRVFVQICRGAAVADQVVEIFSICGPVSEKYLRRALELNAQIPYGSIAIQAVDDKPSFVMSNAYPRSTCDPEEVRKSVLSIAKHADEVEQRLTGQDQH